MWRVILNEAKNLGWKSAGEGGGNFSLRAE
jgi:hypothetical protein